MADSLLVAAAVIVVGTALIWLGSGWLETASQRLAVSYDLPPVVQGSIIAAAGSSFPELASVVFAALAGSFDLGVGAVVGSAVFNILVIPSLSVLMGSGQIDSTRTLVHKETLFYLLSILTLLLTFALALIYNPAEGALSGSVTRSFALLPLAVYGLYLFLQWQDTTEYAGRAETDDGDVRKQWALLLAGLALILVAVERLVDAVIEIGAAAGTPEFLLGAIIVAAATSLPDALVSIRAADNQRDVASVSNVLGSNIFDLLVVIPVGILLTGTASVDLAITAPMMGCLAAVTVIFFVALRTELALSHWEAYLLLGSYGLFVAWVAAEAFAVVDALPG